MKLKDREICFFGEKLEKTVIRKRTENWNLCNKNVTKM